MNCKFAEELKKKEKPRAVMLYANTHLKKRDKDEQNATL